MDRPRSDIGPASVRSFLDWTGFGPIAFSPDRARVGPKSGLDQVKTDDPIAFAFELEEVPLLEVIKISGDLVLPHAEIPGEVIAPPSPLGILAHEVGPEDLLPLGQILPGP